MNGEFKSGDLVLARYLARPAGRHGGPLPGLILCHGFPIGPLDARQSAGTFPELIDRIANELGWVAMTFTFRGCGTSEGDLSLQGWIDDLRAAINHLIDEAGPTGIWLVGTNTGGSVVTCVAADDPRVRGAALLSPRADFDDWAAQPRRFLEHAREIGAIRTP
ncbi:MAG: alpha/beta hydrolase, partial [Ilumatobacteraceae bacterium]